MLPCSSIMNLPPISVPSCTPWVADTSRHRSVGADHLVAGDPANPAATCSKDDPSQKNIPLTSRISLQDKSNVPPEQKLISLTCSIGLQDMSSFALSPWISILPHRSRVNPYSAGCTLSGPIPTEPHG